jgi:uncharacterized protein (DUF433 family)
MQAQENPLFTPTEAAVVTRLSLKAVNNAIDKKTISAKPGRRNGHATRLLDIPALISLTLERRLSVRFFPELRREVFAAVANARRGVVSVEGGLVKVDLREARREVETSLRQLRRATSLVTTDPEVMGGDPVFKGTRIPVHLIARLLEEESTAPEIHSAYPRLTKEMIRLAPVYANAYPQRGRRRTQPWRGAEPRLLIQRPLRTIDKA